MGAFESDSQICSIHGTKQKDGRIKPFVVKFPKLNPFLLYQRNWYGKLIVDEEGNPIHNDKYLRKFNEKTLKCIRMWDKHCVDTKHTIDINQICHNCGIPNVYHNYPYPESLLENSHKQEGMSIVLTCKKCKKPCIPNV